MGSDIGTRLNWLHGELLQMRCEDDSKEVEECFCQVPFAKSIVTRGQMARLLQKQGKVAEAKELLPGIYG